MDRVQLLQARLKVIRETSPVVTDEEIKIISEIFMESVESGGFISEEEVRKLFMRNPNEKQLTDLLEACYEENPEDFLNFIWALDSESQRGWTPGPHPKISPTVVKNLIRADAKVKADLAEYAETDNIYSDYEWIWSMGYNTPDIAQVMIEALKNKLQTAVEEGSYEAVYEGQKAYTRLVIIAFVVKVIRKYSAQFKQGTLPELKSVCRQLIDMVYAAEASILEKEYDDNVANLGVLYSEPTKNVVNAPNHPRDM
ncbi:MAG: hypothetical protein J5613_00330 [Alphaproteobacteria bacterium]|nr:hypothetical protein [Alphaproteobacteria bacterium]